jgi:hypothetical protein
VDRRSLQLCSLPRQSSGHLERLPSGSWRARVYAGKSPLSGREIRFLKTRKTEVEAEIELSKLLELARAGRQPDSDVTVAELLDAYVPVAGWDVSTTETNRGYIRRTIEPALGIKEVRKVRARCWTTSTHAYRSGATSRAPASRSLSTATFPTCGLTSRTDRWNGNRRPAGSGRQSPVARSPPATSSRLCPNSPGSRG